MGIMSSDRLGTSLQYRQKEKGYRDMALKLYPWVCGRCAREFVFLELQEYILQHLTQHQEVS